MFIGGGKNLLSAEKNCFTRKQAQCKNMLTKFTEKFAWKEKLLTMKILPDHGKMLQVPGSAVHIRARLEGPATHLCLVLQY
jgi:hypothetical protein